MIIDTQTINTVVENHGEALNINVDPKYSGRGMYGRKCLAIEYRGNMNDAYTFMFELAATLAAPEEDGRDNEELQYDDIQYWLGELMRNQPRMDNMGDNGLIYWPEISVQD